MFADGVSAEDGEPTVGSMSGLYVLKPEDMMKSFISSLTLGFNLIYLFMLTSAAFLRSCVGIQVPSRSML